MSVESEGKMREDSPKKLFILGAGFSKAVFENMPVLSELTQEIKNIINKNNSEKLQYDNLDELKKCKYERLLNNVEDLLSFLAQPLPWEDLEEVFLKQSILISVSKLISSHIIKCEQNSFCNKEAPEWARVFLQYLHDTKNIVVTFNYDTIIEQLSFKARLTKQSFSSLDENIINRLKPLENKSFKTYKEFVDALKERIGIKNTKTYENLIWEHAEKGIPFIGMYQLPITKLYMRTPAPGLGRLGETPVSKISFQYIKLHGSTNWYYSGSNDLKVQPIYYSNFCYNTKKEHSVEDLNKKDLVPLIIPPTAYKGSFYNLSIISALWNEFEKAFLHSKEIYFVGYSLPDTDYIVRWFFSIQQKLKDKKIYLVNNVKDKKEANSIYEKYSEVFNNSKIIKKYFKKNNSVELMIDDLCKRS